MKTQQQTDEHVISTTGNKTEPIPLDLQIEILKRLPLKSLLKFRCLSKQWCSIIRSRTFTAYIMSLSPPRLLLAYDIHNNIDESRLFFLSLPLFPQDSSMVSKYDILDLRISHFCNSVNGISLFRLLDDRFLICNPTTRQVLEIPNDLSGFDRKCCYMCLGYDPTNDQYKILRSMVSQQGAVQYSVCTLERVQKSSFSSWRHVESNLPYYDVYHGGSCINGVVYHKASTKQSNKNSFVIESFHVGSERLHLIEGPKEFELKSSEILINHQGKVACFLVNNDNSYSFWVLEDIQKQIWSNKSDVFPTSPCDFSRPGPKPMVCGTTNAGEIVFKNILGSDFFIYDLQKKIVRRRVEVGGSKDDDELRRSPGKTVRRIATLCNHVDNIINF